MTEYRVRLPKVVPAGQVAELDQRLFFVSSAITAFDLMWSEGGVGEVALTLDGPVDRDDLAAKVGRLVTEEVLPQKVGPAAVVWRSPVRATAGDVTDDLVDRGELVETGEGQYATGPLVTALLSYLDSELRTRTVRRLGATEYRYPTLIPTEAMRRCDYLASFPQFLMVVTRLHADIDNYRAVRRDAGDPGLVDRLLDYCADSTYCLPPTICYHTYQQLRGTVVPAEGRVVTARGKSFRYEGRYRRSLERLWDFTIRETVFLGDRDQARTGRRAAMDLVTDLVVELDLAGHCEVASDPFFAERRAPERAWSQRLLELKYELRLPVDARRTVAVASFNVHDRYFGTAFGIDRHCERGREPVHTACSGVGLERLAYAFLCRHGVDTAGWPDRLRRAVGRFEGRERG